MEQRNINHHSMIKKHLVSGLCFVVLFSCNNQQNPAQQPNNMDNDSVAARVITGSLSGEYCYAYTHNKDSVLLHVEIGDSVVSGSLSYNLYEKDKNNGTIKGIIKGDTILADYVFMSEGMQSVREVAFLVTDSTAKEGYSEMTDRNNKTIFIKPEKITFDSSFILSKKDCLPKN